jgi:predicted PurR-regulated permease PerM
MEYERTVRLFFFAFLVGIAYELYLIFKPFLAPIIWALVLGFIFHPFAERVLRVTKRRSLVALLIALSLAVAVTATAFWVATLLVRETQGLYATASGLVGPHGAATLLDRVFAWPLAAALSSFLARHGINLEQELKALAIYGARETSSLVVRNLPDVARNVASFTFDFLIMLTTFFFVLRDGADYYRALFDITPLHERDKKEIFDALSRTLAAVIRGVMLTAAAQGVLLGLAFYFLSVPFWASFALAAAASGLLPIGGTTLVWVPIAVYLLYAVGIWHAVALTIWSVAVVAPMDHLAKPMLIGYDSGLTGLALFFGIIGGLREFGVLGIFIGPVLISVFVTLLGVFRRTYGQPDQVRRVATG